MMEIPVGKSTCHKIAPKTHIKPKIRYMWEASAKGSSDETELTIKNYRNRLSSCTPVWVNVALAFEDHKENYSSTETAICTNIFPLIGPYSNLSCNCRVRMCRKLTEFACVGNPFWV